MPRLKESLLAAEASLPKPAVSKLAVPRPVSSDRNVTGFLPRVPHKIARRHYRELHDFPWWPKSFRSFLTNVLVLTWGFPWITWQPNGRRVVPSFASLASRVLRRVLPPVRAGDQTTRVVDLCSGEGGPWSDLHEILDRPDLQVVLTDLYPPNVPTQLRHSSEVQSVRYHADRVDATNIPKELSGTRTMFGCFHHFSPDVAQKILQDAVDQGEAIVIIETCERSLIQMIGAAVLTLPLTFATPIVYFKTTPWHIFLLTYVIPILPLVTCYDGVVSCMRAYKPDEMLAIASRLPDQSSHQWTSGKESFFGLFSLTYMIGQPIPSSQLERSEHRTDKGHLDFKSTALKNYDPTVPNR